MASQKSKDDTGDTGEDKGKMEMLTEMFKSSWIIVLIIGVLFLLVIIIIYIVHLIKKNQLQSVTLTKQVIALNNKSMVPVTINSNQMTTISMGQEFSYSFWILLDGAYDATTNYKTLIQRGNKTTTAGAAGMMYSVGTNPIVILDKTVNTMYICIATNQVTAPKSATQILATNDNGQYTGGYIVSAINYVPLQRWVFIGIVLKQTTMYIFLDGDLYSATSIYDIPSSTRPMISGQSGNLIIGESSNNVHGYLSNAKFYNYAMTQKDMMSFYNQGPISKSILSFLGLSNYGIRAPIYSLDSVDDKT